MSPITMPLWKVIGTETSLFSTTKTFYHHLRQESKEGGGFSIAETLNAWDDALTQNVQEQCTLVMKALWQSSAYKMILDEVLWTCTNNNGIFNNMEGTSVNSALPRRRAASRVSHQEGTALTSMPPRRRNKRHDVDIRDTLTYEQPRTRGGGGKHIAWSASEKLEI